MTKDTGHNKTLDVDPFFEVFYFVDNVFYGLFFRRDHKYIHKWLI